MTNDPESNSSKIRVTVPLPTENRTPASTGGQPSLAKRGYEPPRDRVYAAGRIVEVELARIALYRFSVGCVTLIAETALVVLGAIALFG